MFYCSDYEKQSTSSLLIALIIRKKGGGNIVLRTLPNITLHLESSRPRMGVPNQLGNPPWLCSGSQTKKLQHDAAAAVGRSSFTSDHIPPGEEWVKKNEILADKGRRERMNTPMAPGMNNFLLILPNPIARPCTCSPAVSVSDRVSA